MWARPHSRPDCGALDPRSGFTAGSPPLRPATHRRLHLVERGVPSTLVAEWAGHSVQVLLRVYAKCIEGQDVQGRRLIDGALGDPEPAEDTEHDDE